MTLLSIWRAAIALPARRPFLFLVVSLLLAGTDLMLWRMGIYDGAKAPAGTGVAFLIAKLAILLSWALLALRLVDGPDRSIGAALRLDRRQLGWLAGTLPALALLFGLRLALTRLAGLALEPRTALIAALVLYLVISLILLVRLLPAWIGVLLGDNGASLGWSWRATKGAVTPSVLLVITAIAPAAALHIALNLSWLADAPAFRAATLLVDGVVMALLVAIAMAAYRALYLRAKA